MVRFLATWPRGGAALTLMLVLSSALPVAASARDEYSKEGGKACLDCHGTPAILGILDTVHAQQDDPKTPAAQKQCQSCHGPSAAHMNFPMQVENVHFGKKSVIEPAVQNEKCLECHANGSLQEWEGSAHGYDDVVCSTCHSLHDPEKIVPSHASESSGCTESCHQDLMPGKGNTDYSHAVGRVLGSNGTLSCDSCHNPHGPLYSDRCLNCHAQTPEILAKQSEKARRFHSVAEKQGTECMRCHKGLAHLIAPLELEKTSREMDRMLTK